MTIALIPTRPEAIGALSVAEHHRRAAEDLRWSMSDRPRRRRQLINRHKAKEMKLRRRAERLEGV